MLLQGSDNDLAVALGRKPVPLAFEPPPKILAVVELAVEHEHERAVGGDDGLSSSAEVSDGEAAMPEHNTALMPVALPIRPTMSKTSEHRRHALLRVRVTDDAS